MKIAMVSLNAGPPACVGAVATGSQSVAVDGLARAVAIAGHDVNVYTQCDDPAHPRCSVTAAGVHIDCLDVDPPMTESGELSPARIEALGARFMRDWSIDRPDVVHAHSWISGKAAAAAARTLGIPVVQTFYGVGKSTARREADRAPSLRVRAEAELARSSARIVATSSSEVFALLGLGANPRAIRLIPCGVDLEAFVPTAGPVSASFTTPFRVATLGRLTPDGGVGDAIAALAHLPNVELAVGGGRFQAGGAPPLQADACELEHVARRCAVSSRITFAGRVLREHVAAFLRSADLVVCAPWEESTGSVAREAMACGLPVIASTVGALVDVVADGMTGIHVPARAPRQLAYAIEALQADPLRRRRLGRYGFERAAARYGWGRIAADTLDVYRSVSGCSAIAARQEA